MCRTPSLSATPLLLVKPCLVLIMSTAMFVLYGDIIVKFWAMKSRKEEWRRKQIRNCNGDLLSNMVPREKLFKGFSPEPIFKNDLPVKLTAFKICGGGHHDCKIQTPNSCPDETDESFNEAKIKKIFRYLKDSKYVLCILTVYFFSWVPWILTFFIDFLLIQSNYYNEKARLFCGNFSLQNSEILLLKIQDELKDKVSIHLTNITSDATDQSTVCRAITKVYEDVTFDLVTRLYVVTGAFSCVVDPVIYALWYRPVRKQVAELVSSVKSTFTSITMQDQLKH